VTHALLKMRAADRPPVVRELSLNFSLLNKKIGGNVIFGTIIAIFASCVAVSLSAVGIRS